MIGMCIIYASMHNYVDYLLPIAYCIYGYIYICLASEMLRNAWWNQPSAIFVARNPGKQAKPDKQAESHGCCIVGSWLVSYCLLRIAYCLLPIACYLVHKISMSLLLFHLPCLVASRCIIRSVQCVICKRHTIGNMQQVRGNMEWAIINMQYAIWSMQ